MIDINYLQKKCIEEYQSGKSFKVIGDKYGLFPNVVSFLVQAADVEVRKHASYTKNRKKLPMKEIKKMYLDEKYELEEIAEEYGVSTSLIASRLRESGVKLRGKKNKI